MNTDLLNRPLAPRRDSAAADLRPGSGLIGVVAAMIVVAGSLAFVWIKGDPLGGEPHAIVRIERNVQAAQGAAAAPAAPAAKVAADSNRETALESEMVAGVRVIRGRGGQAPGSIIVKVPEENAGVRVAGLDRRLSERGRHGPLPKTDSAGGAPRSAYARPFDTGKAAGRPLIAIVVTGLGIGATATADAIEKLPGEVTFAFAPYGSDLDRQTSTAREKGHELLLQAPMEPYGYPNNDTGPHTLLAEAAEAQNIDRLHWLMSRFQGYVGVTNFMGAKFTSQRPALKPVLDEIARRGLLFVDDGASPRSLVSEVADTANLPAVRGDTVLDGVDRQADFEAALARAENQARAGGRAIVFGPALPATIERLNRWARSLESKGFVLAPVSAVVAQKG